jgi:hypothetical protein
MSSFPSPLKSPTATETGHLAVLTLELLEKATEEVGNVIVKKQTLDFRFGNLGRGNLGGPSEDCSTQEAAFCA